MLFDEGLARLDRLRRGVDMIGRQLFAGGPMTKAMVWEMTAMPDLRRQCGAPATHLAGLVGGRPA